ncbi:MAG: hypothetical protein VX725_03335, partial [Actinomycetota bacterium]|nr:hypothetical protein [Actinomycetota bacterium]
MEDTENIDKDQETEPAMVDSLVVEPDGSEGMIEASTLDEDVSIYPDEEEHLGKNAFFENLEAPQPRPRRPRRPSIFERRRRVRLQARRVRRI